MTASNTLKNPPIESDGIIESAALDGAALRVSANGKSWWDRTGRDQVRRLPVRMLGGVFSSSSLSLADQTLVSATNFFTTVLLGRSDPTGSQLGVYQLGFAVVLLATCIQSALISTPYAVFGIRMAEDRRAAYARNTVTHQSVFSSIFSVMLVLLGLTMAWGWAPAGFSAVNWILAVVLPLILVREFVRRVAFAHLRVGTALLLDILVTCLQVGGLLALRFSGNLSASTAFLVTGLACAAASAATFGLIAQKFSTKSGNSFADLGLNWTFGRWALAGQLAYLGIAYTIPWILALDTGTELAGRLAACSSLVMISNPLMIGLSNYLTPLAVHSTHSGGIEALRKLVLRSTLAITAIMSVLVILLLLTAGHLLTLVYGTHLAQDHWVVVILALGVLGICSAIGADSGLMAMHRPQIIFWSHFSGLITTISLGLALIPLYGVMGAAIAIFAGQTLAGAVKIVWFVWMCRDSSAIPALPKHA